MSERLTVVSKPMVYESMHPRTEGLAFVAERVVAMRTESSPAIVAANFRPTGVEREHGLTVEADAADRILDFYDQCYARRVDRAQTFFNCKVFVSRALGRISQLKIHDDYNLQPLTPISDDTQLQPGIGYVIPERDVPENQHSVLGMNDPDLNLSVVGDYCSLVVMSNTTTLGVYHGSGFLELAA